MDFNIFKIEAFIVLAAVYLTVRKLFVKFADFTENMEIKPVTRKN